MTSDEKTLNDQIVARNKTIHEKNKEIATLEQKISNKEIIIKGQNTFIDSMLGTGNELVDIMHEATQAALNDYSPVIEAEKILKEAK